MFGIKHIWRDRTIAPERASRWAGDSDDPSSGQPAPCCPGQALLWPGSHADVWGPAQPILGWLPSAPVTRGGRRLVRNVHKHTTTY